MIFLIIGFTWMNFVIYHHAYRYYINLINLNQEPVQSAIRMWHLRHVKPWGNFIMLLVSNAFFAVNVFSSILYHKISFYFDNLFHYASGKLLKGKSFFDIQGTIYCDDDFMVITPH